MLFTHLRKSSFKSGLLFMLLSFALFTNGCFDLGEKVATNGDNSMDPEEAPTWSNDIAPLFAERCSPCHISRSDGGLNLSTYENATSDEQIIDPGNADNSVLVDRIKGTITPRMPLGGDPLSAEQIQNIRDWIDNGAKDD
ncbi:MAG: hypothetical protein GF315_11070 [candidate division Zixibacteria bacterium]|nr:hypothetical protein [candidate division Zixibacteria bacterium]